MRALYEFLGAPAGYSSRQWSEAVGCEGGATKLADLFKATAWRATKNRVDHAIPPQRSVLRHLTFDAVERFVYDRLDEACARDLAALTGDAVNEACSLQGGGVSRLRQACVHPSLAMPRRKRRKRKRGIVEEPKAVATKEEGAVVQQKEVNVKRSPAKAAKAPKAAGGGGGLARILQLALAVERSPSEPVSKELVIHCEDLIKFASSPSLPRSAVSGSLSR